jgi:PilZ domain
MRLDYKVHVTEQRRTKRFDIQLPLEIQRSGSQRVARIGRTRNISSGGVLFTSDAQVEVGGVIEYIVNLPGGPGGPVSLRCLGKVLRLERLGNSASGAPQSSFAIAATLERYEFQRN